MNRRFLYLLPAFVLPLAAHAQAGDRAQIEMRCGANQDRVWVYDTLTDLNIEAKLKCNETVEIVSRVKGYVKIRSSNGTEGYVPDSVFPDLAPLPPSPGDTVAGSALANAAANNRARIVRSPLLETKSSTATGAPATLSSAAPALPASTETTALQATASAPVSAAVAEGPPIAPSLTQPIGRRTTASASSEAPAAVTAKAEPALSPTTRPSIAPPPVSVSAPVISARTTPASSPEISRPVSAPVVEASTPAPIVASAAPAKILAPVAPAAPPAKKAQHNASAIASVAAAAAPASAEPPASLTEAKMDVNPAVVLSQPKVKPALVESEDYPDTTPENESADPACHTYFSAYGLSPSQFKWLAANRKKEYPSVCPAPNVASVDFVILFTHDSATYTDAMPEPVHTDHSGFSDFNPLTTVDSALLSGANADKAHREYVWVFEMKRGAFDPAKFSPRRRPQFTTVESKGSARALEDAFGFVQERGPTQIAANH